MLAFDPSHSVHDRRASLSEEAPISLTVGDGQTARGAPGAVTQSGTAGSPETDGRWISVDDPAMTERPGSVAESGGWLASTFEEHGFFKCLGTGCPNGRGSRP